MISVQEWRSLGTFREIGGHRLFVVDSGGRRLPTLLLIHGFPTASWDYAGLYKALARSHRIIAPDLLGFGFSDKPAGHLYSIVEQAGLLDELLKALDVPKADVLAHDYGDSVAQELLARQRAGELETGLSSVCFLNGGLFPETHRPRLIQRLLLTPLGPLIGRTMTRRAFDRSMRGVFAPDTPPSKAELDGFWQLINEGHGRRVVHKLLRYIPERVAMRERWVDALKHARIPLGFINGTADPVSGEAMVCRFEEVVGTNRFVRRLADVGHYPQVERPEVVLEAYRDFRRQPVSDGRSAPIGTP